MQYRRFAFLVILTLSLALSSSGCFFSGGVTTINKKTSALGSGFLSATERNGQWASSGPPPTVGAVTEQKLYRRLDKTGIFSVGYLGNVYELADPYSPRRYRVAAIREVGTDTEGNATIHYYEVEFDPVSNEQGQ